MRDIVEVMLAINCHAYSFEAGNVRHEHEWRVWQDVKLPDDKLILPGVVSHATNVVEHPELVADRILRFADLWAGNASSPPPIAVSAAASTRISPGPSSRRWHREPRWRARSYGVGCRRPEPSRWHSCCAPIDCAPGRRRAAKGRRLPLAICVKERLLIAVARSKADRQLSASSCPSRRPRRTPETGGFLPVRFRGAEVEKTGPSPSATRTDIF